MRLCAAPASWGQQSPLGPLSPPGGAWFRYIAPGIPASRLANSTRLHGLIQGGKLYLTSEDAIALAIENNIDIETDRYNALIVMELYAPLAGGPLPGVPSGSSQAAACKADKALRVAKPRPV